MEISHESYRTISHDFGYSVDALKRHKAKHLVIDLSEIKQAMEEARVVALEEVKEKELEEFKAQALEGTASRLENAKDYFDQLREIRAKAAKLLDQAEASEDLKAAGIFLKELREQIRLAAELEGRLASQPQINILVHPEWIELRTKIVSALEAYPEAQEAVVRALP